jgi:hypothetical protein
MNTKCYNIAPESNRDVALSQQMTTFGYVWIQFGHIQKKRVKNDE